MVVLAVSWMGCIGGEDPLETQTSELRRRNEGRRLFEEETFGGNGRTCTTCHSRDTGTVSIEDANERFEEDPSDPLFVQDGSDDGAGNGVTRMLANATIRVRLPLADNVHIANREDDGSFTILPDREVFLNRGIPTTLNTPSLDPVLMYDGREPDLEDQALGAIHTHADPAVEPTAQQLALIAEFEQTNDFFTSTTLRRFAHGGKAPTLPRGRTASEKRGRRFFVETPQIPFEPATGGHCAQCHTGPMLDHVSAPDFQLMTSLPEGARFQNIATAEFNGGPQHDFNMNPLLNWVFDMPDGSQVVIENYPDIGRAAITGDPAFDPAFDGIGAFKINTLWGVCRSAPYFHNNSARTLEEVADHYQQFFDLNFDFTGGLVDQRITDQDKADIVAYMKLLDPDCSCNDDDDDDD